MQRQLESLPALKDKIKDLEHQQASATQQLSEKQSIITGLDNILIKQNGDLTAMTKENAKDVAGEPASSASAIITSNVLDGKPGYPITVINTGKRNMYDVTVSIQELIDPDESPETTLKKIREAASYHLSMILPGRADPILDATVPYIPPVGSGFAITVTSCGGGSEQDVYRRTVIDGKPRSRHEKYKNQTLVFSKTY